MNKNIDSKKAIYNAIIWASMILATAILLEEQTSQSGNFILILQIAAWYSTSLLFTKNSSKAEWACIKNRLSRLR